MQQQWRSDMHKTYLSLTISNVIAKGFYVFNARRKHHRIKQDIFRLKANNTLHIIKHYYTYHHHHHHYQIYDQLLDGSLKTTSGQVPHTVRASGNKKLRLSPLRPRWGMIVHKRVFSTIKFMGLSNATTLSHSPWVANIRIPGHPKNQIWLASSSFSTLSCLRHLSEIECSFSWITASWMALLKQTIRSCLKETFDTNKSTQVGPSLFRHGSPISHRLVSKGALRKIKTTW